MVCSPVAWLLLRQSQPVVRRLHHADELRVVEMVEDVAEPLPNFQDQSSLLIQKFPTDSLSDFGLGFSGSGACRIELQLTPFSPHQSSATT